MKAQKRQGYLRDYIKNLNQRGNMTDVDPIHMASKMITEEIKQEYMVNDSMIKAKDEVQSSITESFGELAGFLGKVLSKGT